MYTITPTSITSPYPQKRQKVIYYPSINHIGIIGAYSDGNISKSFRGLFDLTNKNTIVCEILDNGNCFSGNINQEIKHSEDLLDSEYVNLVYNRYSQSAPSSLLLSMMTNPCKQFVPYPCLQSIDSVLYNTIHGNSSLNNDFGL